MNDDPRPSMRRLERAAEQFVAVSRRSRAARRRAGQSAGNEAAVRTVELVDRWQQVDDARTVFLDTAAHELRTPVTVLSGYLRLLHDGSFGSLPMPADDVVRLLTAKTDELNRLVDQILEVIRIDDIHVGREAASCDVGLEVGAVVAEWQPLVRKGQELSLESPPGRLVASIDGARLRTIVTNLVTNAIKYTEGGEIEVLVNRDDDHARVAVRDHGPGIRSEDAASVFERCVRVGPADETRGTGLGLHIARELARLNDGDVTLQSTPGKGSTFTLELPLGHPAKRG